MKEVTAFFVMIVLVVIVVSTGMTINNSSRSTSNVGSSWQFGLPGPPGIRAAAARPVTAADSVVQTQDFFVPASEPVPTQESVPVLPPTRLEIFSTQNVEYSTALLRGEVVVGNETLTNLYFIYGYDRTDVEAGRTDSTDQLLVASTQKSSRTVSAPARSLSPDTKYYARLCGRVGARQRCTETTSFTTNPRVTRVSDSYVPTIGSIDIEHFTAEEIQFEVRVQMNDYHDGEVFLLYGESQAQVTDAIGEEYRDIDEDDKDLQKVRVYQDLRGLRDFAVRVDDLEPDTVQYYAWCVEYGGIDDGIVCSRVYSERTHIEEFGLTPDIKISSVPASDSVAQLRGEVDMDDFRNGIVFFVYGTDYSRITNIGGAGTFTGLSQYGDSLQKRLVDSDLDRSDDYVLTIVDLQPQSDYVARLCVEYKNQDSNYYERQFVTCSEVVEFGTL